MAEHYVLRRDGMKAEEIRQQIAGRRKEGY